MSTSTRVHPLVLWMLCSLVLLAVPYWNGYPLVYSDTGTYLRTAFSDYSPPDRPIWYGLFIRYSSLGGLTLWGPVVVQSVLLGLLVAQSIRRMDVDKGVLPLLLMVLLVLFTGISWYAGQLMPDIFTGIGLLACLLLLGGSGTIGHHLLWLAALLLSVTLHPGNAPILAGTSVVSALMYPMLRRSLVRVMAGAVLILAFWAFLPDLSQGLTGRPAARPAHVFLMGRLLDSGVLHPFLEEHCSDRSWELCAHIDELPTNSQDLLWHSNSPLQHMGGWAATRSEFNEIIRDALSEPDLLAGFLLNTLKNTLVQLTTISMGRDLAGTWYALPESPPYQQIALHMPHELDAYLASRMNRMEGMTAAGSLRFADAALRSGWILTVAALAWLLKVRGWPSSRVRGWFVFAVFALFMNAFICAGTSVVADRFQSRMSWLVMLVVWSMTGSSILNGSARPQPSSHQGS